MPFWCFLYSMSSNNHIPWTATPVLISLTHFSPIRGPWYFLEDCIASYYLYFSQILYCGDLQITIWICTLYCLQLESKMILVMIADYFYFSFSEPWFYDSFFFIFAQKKSILSLVCALSVLVTGHQGICNSWSVVCSRCCVCIWNVLLLKILSVEGLVYYLSYTTCSIIPCTFPAVWKIPSLPRPRWNQHFRWEHQGHFLEWNASILWEFLLTIAL